MYYNENTIRIKPRPKNHPGFVDAEGTELNPGDEIIVCCGDMLFHSVITRFTPRRIYWKIVKAHDRFAPAKPHRWTPLAWEGCTQLHYWYSDTESKRALRKVLKVQETT